MKDFKSKRKSEPILWLSILANKNEEPMNLTILMEEEDFSSKWTEEFQFEADTYNGDTEIYIECKTDKLSSETYFIASWTNECVRSFMCLKTEIVETTRIETKSNGAAWMSNNTRSSRITKCNQYDAWQESACEPLPKETLDQNKREIESKNCYFGQLNV